MYENIHIILEIVSMHYQNLTTNKTNFVDTFLKEINKFGNIITYEQESHFRGSYLGNELPFGITMVTPRKNQTTASDASTQTIKLHQDMSILEIPPPYTFLMGIQEHPDIPVYTRIVSNLDLYQLLSPDVQQCLQKPFFQQNKPKSYSESQHFIPFNRSLLVMVPLKGPMFKLRTTDTDEIQPVNNFSDYCYQQLLQKRDYAEKYLSQKYLLKGGDMLIIDNHRSVHTRDSFPAYFDGTDRIILRAYVEPYPSQKNRKLINLLALFIVYLCLSTMI